MVMENKRLVMTVITFAGIIAGILLVNRWIAGEMKDLAPNPVERSAAPQPVEKPQQTAKRPRPVLIDPLHDPLAPVVPRKNLKSSVKKAAPRPTSSQRIYEPAETSVILTQ